jgi:hypothetical protein
MDNPLRLTIRAEEESLERCTLHRVPVDLHGLKVPTPDETACGWVVVDADGLPG